MATVWEQIQEKRKSVEALKEMYRTTYAKAMADGELSDQEKAQLATIDAGVNKAQGIVKGLEDEFEANKKKWDGRAKDKTALQRQEEELLDWGEPKYDSIKVISSAMNQEAVAMAWLNAIDKLDRAMAVTKPLYDEYKKQLPFREKYNENHGKIEESRKTHGKSNFSKKESLANSLTAVDNSLKAAEDSAEDRKFDDACRHLGSAKATADDIGNEIKELRTKHDECVSKFADIKAQVAIYGASKYKTVQAMNEKFAANEGVVANFMEQYDYDRALTEIEHSMKTAVAQMKAEHERLEQEETDWKETDPALQEAKKKAEEVKEFSGEDVDTKASEASGKAAEEDFKAATEQAKQGVQDAEAAHQEMQQKKAARSSEMDDLQKKIDDLLAAI